MKKKFGITLGGVQQKIVNLVLVFIIAITSVFGAVSFFQNKNLTETAGEATEEQKRSINQVSGKSMEEVITANLIRNSGLQAAIADEIFSDLRKDVVTLQLLAETVFENSGENTGSSPVLPPDPHNDGLPAAQLLCEKGVDSADSQYAVTASMMTDTMLSLYKSSDILNNCYLGLEDGTLICVDEHSANKFDENGNIIPFAARERPWYKGASETGGVYFTEPVPDTYTDNIAITCSAPVYANGKLVGVVGADIFLDSLSEFVEKMSDTYDTVCIVNDKGEIIFSSAESGFFSVKHENGSDDPILSGLISSTVSDSSNIILISADGKEYYMSGVFMKNSGWTLVSVVDKSAVHRPAETMLEQYNTINGNAVSKFRMGAKKAQNSTLFIIIVILILGSATALVVANKIVRPVESMTNQINDISGTDNLFEMRKEYCTNDEIEVLAKAFENLTETTRKYISDITEITKEKERINTELDLAKRIQADMLPNNFPPFPEIKKFSIFASMSPAKEVGGDFYDFFLIDEEHLGITMADVSGKGIPAALFMMASKIIINNLSVLGVSHSPAEILRKMNEMLYKYNKSDMFVTVWFGILEISTGKITAANAGHEYPIIRQPGQNFELLKDKHGLVIGAMENIRYREYDFTLQKGGTLFLYTDGVPEATNSENELFGTVRLLESMNACPDSADPEKLLLNIRQSVDEFVGDAPQFDDLTMLAITIN